MSTYQPGDPKNPIPAPRAVGVADVDKGKLPTKKLLSAAATMAVIYVASLFTDVDENLEQLINLIVPLLVAYFVPNDLTPGGVPDAKPKVIDLSEERGQAGPTTIILWCLAILCILVVLYVLVGAIR